VTVYCSRQHHECAVRPDDARLFTCTQFVYPARRDRLTLCFTHLKYPPRKLKGNEIYSNYRWVLALENVAEPGYLTEKLVNAQASGAVPVYYGDSR
jgi:hypothetical protein